MAHTRISAMKAFFNPPEVTNGELIKFRKADPKGFEEIGDLCIKALEKKN